MKMPQIRLIAIEISRRLAIVIVVVFASVSAGMVHNHAFAELRGLTQNEAFQALIP